MVPPSKMCQQGRENIPNNFSLFNEHCSCVVCVGIFCTNFGSHDCNHHTLDHLQLRLWASILISERLEKGPKWEEVGIRKGEAGFELIGRKASRVFHNNGLSQALRVQDQAFGALWTVQLLVQRSMDPANCQIWSIDSKSWLATSFNKQSMAGYIYIDFISE